MLFVDLRHRLPNPPVLPAAPIHPLGPCRRIDFQDVPLVEAQTAPRGRPTGQGCIRGVNGETAPEFQVNKRVYVGSWISRSSMPISLFIRIL